MSGFKFIAMIRLLLCLVFTGSFFIQANGQQQAQTANEHMNQQSFEELVKAFNSPGRDYWQKPEEIFKLLGPLKGRKIIDIGCGTGYFSFRLVDSGAIVIAADVDDRFLGYVDSVREARNISAKKLQTRKLPPNDPLIEKREADIVLIVNTYHHLEDRVNYLKKIKSGLRSNGFVVIIDYFNKELPIGPPVAMKQSADDITRDLKLAGFSFFKTEDKILPYHYIVLSL